MTSVEETPTSETPGGLEEPPQSGLAEAAQASLAATPGVADSPAAPTPRPSWIGVWALAMSLLGLVGLLPIVGSVLGIVLGRVAIRRADAGPVRGGRGTCVAAFVIGLVTLAVIAFGCAAYSLIVAFGPG